MFTLRCTHKLLRRGLTESLHGEVAPTTLLGDWYANVLVTRPQHLVICNSARTLLPAIVPAKSVGAIPARLVEASRQCQQLTRQRDDSSDKVIARLQLAAGYSLIISSMTARHESIPAYRASHG